MVLFSGPSVHISLAVGAPEMEKVEVDQVQDEAEGVYPVSVILCIYLIILPKSKSVQQIEDNLSTFSPIFPLFSFKDECEGSMVQLCCWRRKATALISCPTEVLPLPCLTVCCSILHLSLLLSLSLCELQTVFCSSISTFVQICTPILLSI